MTWKFDTELLRQWFLQHKRDLPWRENASPYAVWVSEIMLQQTQVSVVIPYFEKWMNRFPTIESLANAPLDEVIKLWEGLGYYSRARNLHSAAQYILQHHDGQLPKTEIELSNIKGLGPYTIGAIRSFAFHQKAAAVDGNVLRVLSRYFLIEEDICKAKTVQQIRTIAEQILPDHEPWTIAEAIIELGATVCQKRARCGECPIRASCKAYVNGMADQLPIKSKKASIEQLFRAVAVVACGDQFLVKRGESGKIMSDLHEFPYLESTVEGISDKEFAKQLKARFGLNAKALDNLPEISHSFTRYRVQLRPVMFNVEALKVVEGHQWHSLKDLQKLAFSSGHRRILEALARS